MSIDWDYERSRCWIQEDQTPVGRLRKRIIQSYECGPLSRTSVDEILKLVDDVAVAAFRCPKCKNVVTECSFCAQDRTSVKWCRPDESAGAATELRDSDWPWPESSRRCNCWLGTSAKCGDSDVRRACPVHGDRIEEIRAIATNVAASLQQCVVDPRGTGQPVGRLLWILKLSVEQLTLAVNR